MNWNKPRYINCRFGFEVTMYIGVASPSNRNQVSRTKVCLGATGAVAAMLLLAAGSAMAGGGHDDHDKNVAAWRVSGFDLHNHADSSKVSRLNKQNIKDLKLKWIYNIPPVPFSAAVPCNYTGSTSNLPCPPIGGVGTNPVNQNRPSYGASNTVSVDRDGRVYFPTYDGRLFALDSKHTSNTLNPDGTAAPTVLLDLDLWADPQYITPSQLPEENVYNSRMYPTLTDDAVYAGNFSIYYATTSDSNFGTWNTQGMHYPNPSDPYYRGAGAVLYKLDRGTGKLVWKTVLDSQIQSGVPSTGGTPIYDTPKGDLLIVPFQVSNLSGNLGTFPVSSATTPLTDPFGGHCCDGRGGLAAVRISDGKVMWKTYLVPNQKFKSTVQVINDSAKEDCNATNGCNAIDAWTGGNMWGGGTMPYSKKLNLLYGGTSEAYSAPNAAIQCEMARLSAGGAPIDSTCLHYNQSGPSNASYHDNVVEATTPYQVNSPRLPFVDTVFAVDAATGKIKWAQPIGGFDVWNTSVLPPAYYFFNAQFFAPTYLGLFPSAPLFPAISTQKDLDAATAPVLIENVKMADGKRHDVIIGSGKGAGIYAFDAETGKPLWPAVQFGQGGLNGGGFVWGLATDGKRIYGSSGASSDVSLADLNRALHGGPNPKHIVLDGSCLPSGFSDPNNPNQTDPALKIWGGSGNGGGNGGMYVAVDIATGQIAWQRCAIGLQGKANRTLTTVTPVADCISGQAAKTSPNDSCAPRTANAAPSVSNGVVIATGVNNFNDSFTIYPETNVPFAEVLLLDAKNGHLLRELPLGVLGKPAANPPIYNRSISVGDQLYISTGGHAFLNNGLDPARDYYRVVAYELPSKKDEHCDGSGPKK